MAKKQAYTIKQGLDLARNYCSVQERSQAEVCSKLISWGLDLEQAEEVVSSLILEGFINESRYASIYARSKFNQNHWGKIKIKYSLRQKGISDICIREALEEINQEKYYSLCEKLAQKKWGDLKGEGYVSKKMKTISFLNSKGFEYEIINNIIENLTTK